MTHVNGDHDWDRWIRYACKPCELLFYWDFNFHEHLSEEHEVSLKVSKEMEDKGCLI